MRARVIVSAAAVLGVVVVPFAVAGVARDSRGPDAITSAANKKLKQRINQLAKRVAALERKEGRPRPPSGAAGGDLTGSFPNPTLASGAVGTAEQSSSIPAARVTNSAQQTIPADQSVPLTFDTELYDTANMHSTNFINNSAMRAPVDGIYLVTAQVTWASGGALSVRLIQLVKNGSQLLAEVIEPQNVNLGGPIYQTRTTQAPLQAGDFVQVVGRQNSATDQTVFKDDELTPEFSMTWLAPGP